MDRYNNKMENDTEFSRKMIQRSCQIAKGSDIVTFASNFVNTFTFHEPDIPVVTTIKSYNSSDVYLYFINGLI